MKTREPYESVLRFMLWSGLGADEVLEINSSPQIQANIGKQMTDNSKDYVVIDLEPRKHTLTRYFTVVPKRYLPKFPIRSLDYKIRGGNPITRQNLEERFRKAATQVGLYQMGLGPHTLRSAFRSQCVKSGVSEPVCEFVMGHGGGDRYGYSREVLDEQYAASELRKLWAGQTRVPDVLASALHKMSVIRDRKALAQALNEDEMKALEKHGQELALVLKETEEPELRNVVTRIMTVSRLRESGAAHPTPEKTHLGMKEKDRERRRPGRTAQNGGAPVDSPYETRIVGEEGLVPLLNEGWEIVKELSNSKIVLRRANTA